MYGTVAGFIAYANARGNEAPADDIALSTAALQRASDYVRARYVAYLLPGYDDTLPQVTEAAYVIASEELADPNTFATFYTANTSKTLVQAGQIKWSKNEGMKTGTVEDAMKTSPLVDLLMHPFVSRPTRDQNYMFASNGGF